MPGHIVRLSRSLSLFVLFVFGGLSVTGISSATAAPVLVGTVLPNDPPAPTFTLTDQQNHQYSLSSSKGKVVVLTFLYTHCTDVCPFIATKLKDASTLLGNDNADVDFVVITVDPERDTPALLAAYSKEFGMYDRWHFVTGTHEQVAPLWKAYGVEVKVDKDSIATLDMNDIRDLESEGLRNGMSNGDVSHALKAIGLFGGGYDIDHSTPIIFIDKTGHMRALLDENAAPADIAADARALF
jgi:cytochrome oxidase Cu insertion factor (SCO1/SenC/PrrC family)